MRSLGRAGGVPGVSMEGLRGEVQGGARQMQGCGAGWRQLGAVTGDAETGQTQKAAAGP